MSKRPVSLASEVVALLRNPEPKKAIAFYEIYRKKMGWPYPSDGSVETVALACVHKARVAWPGATKAMVRESKAWLIAHGMSPQLGVELNHTVQ